MMIYVVSACYVVFMHSKVVKACFDTLNNYAKPRQHTCRRGHILYFFI